MFDFDVVDRGELGKDERRRLDPRGAGGMVVGLGAVRLAAPITDVPRGPALTLAPEATVATALEAMGRRRRGALIVVQNQRSIGVVTDRDILGYPLSGGETVRGLPLSAVMVPCPEPIRDTDTVAAALRLMCARRQWHLPIVCGQGLFLGAVDVTDLSMWLRDRLTLMTVDACFAESP